MIEKVPTMYERFCKLAETIGPLHKAGNKEATADLDALESAILTAIGVFKDDAEDRIHKLIRRGVFGQESAEEKAARQQEIDAYRAKREAENAAARETVNALCRKYGVPLVFPTDATDETVATELAIQTAVLLKKGAP